MKKRRGLVMINTGLGKGKTTAALGSAVRAAGQGLKVLIIQFIKGAWPTGEMEALRRLPGVEIRPMGLGLIAEGDEIEPHRVKARQAWSMAIKEIRSGAWDMVILDEACLALHWGFLDPDEMAGLIKTKPPALHLILTGRHCPAQIMALADTVTRMDMLKHHFAAGVESQAGVEF